LQEQSASAVGLILGFLHCFGFCQTFSGKKKGEMQTSEDQKIQQNEAIGSFAPRYEADTVQPIGSPWSTGLFDCHENQTNGIIYFTLITRLHVQTCSRKITLMNVVALFITGFIYLYLLHNMQ